MDGCPARPLHDRDLQMRHAGRDEIDRRVRIPPLHEVQEGSVSDRMSALQNGSKWMIGRESGKRNLETAASRQRQSRPKYRAKNDDIVALDGDKRQIGLTECRSGGQQSRHRNQWRCEIDERTQSSKPRCVTANHRLLHHALVPNRETSAHAEPAPHDQKITNPHSAAGEQPLEDRSRARPAQTGSGGSCVGEERRLQEDRRA